MTELNELKDPVVKTEAAIVAAGNKAKLAKALGIARSSVQVWGEYVPRTQVYRVVKLFPDLGGYEK